MDAYKAAFRRDGQQYHRKKAAAEDPGGTSRGHHQRVNLQVVGNGSQRSILGQSGEQTKRV